MAANEKAWILGYQYEADEQSPFPRNSSGDDDLKGDKEFKRHISMSRHVESFFRFTYRKDLPPLSLTPYNSITTDAGWGCMLRAAQMLMGHTMRLHFFGKGDAVSVSSTLCYSVIYVN